MVVAWLGWGAILHADPAVRFPTGAAAWTVDVTASKIADKPIVLGGVAVKKVEVVQNSRIRSDTVSYYNGASRTTYEVTGTNLLLTQDPKGTVFLTPASNIFKVPYLPSTFDWVGPALLQEKDPIEYEGKLCYHYKGPAGEAWVDSKTQFPVAIDNATALATFTFHGAPDTPLALPPQYQQLLNHYAAAMGLPRAKPVSTE